MIVDVEPHGEGSVDATGTGQADGPAPSPVLLTDEELRAEVIRRRLLVEVQANDPHDGYFAFDDPANAEGYFDGSPFTWRSDVTWRTCEKCDATATQMAYGARRGWFRFCPAHTPELSAAWNSIRYEDGTSKSHR